MPTDRAKAIELIRKLWATAAHKSTPRNEARSAWERAWELIREHHIGLDELPLPPESPPLTEMEQMVPTVSDEELGLMLRRAGNWLVEMLIPKK